MLQFDPDLYLGSLMRDLMAFGGIIRLLSFETPRDLVSLPEPLMVNSTGRGAGKLFGAGELTPVKRQLTVLAPQPEVSHWVTGMVSPGSGIVLEHAHQPAIAALAVDRAEVARGTEVARTIVQPPDPSACQPFYRPPPNAPAADTFLSMDSRNPAAGPDRHARLPARRTPPRSRSGVAGSSSRGRDELGARPASSRSAPGNPGGDRRASTGAATDASRENLP